MQKYFGLIIIALFITIVIVRSYTLKKQDIQPVEFGKKDKNDLAIIPFAAFYLYLLVANAFNFPTIPNQIMFHPEHTYYPGVVFCVSALVFFIWTMVSFNKSFRVGLVDNKTQGLVTNGAFSISRNPIYVSFAAMLIGQFLIFPGWIFLIYIFLGIFTFHRQTLKEERFLRLQYGKQFEDYFKKVRRYL